jgi:hypothetical protein
MLPIAMANKGIKTGYDSCEYEDFDDDSTRFIYDFPHVMDLAIETLWSIGERRNEDWEEDDEEDLWFY